MPEYHWVSDDIFTVTDFLTPAECAEYIALGEALGFTAAPISTFFGPAIHTETRSNMRVMLDDPERAAELWRRAAPFVPEELAGRSAVGVNERLRLYRYEVGQQFDWHRDGAFERPNGERSLLTFMVYLNDDFTGGATAFADRKIIPVRGMALFFVHSLLHKGEPVMQGRKYVLRTDVLYAPRS
jgi:predicted 2-oxoglutarate/Fe(II)-dependent dioxygenase YbiX